jgi:hypothetical protein
VNSTDYKEAEQEFSIADGIITANQKDNKLSCGDMLMVADKYAYAAKEYRKTGAEEKAQVADDKTARTIGALKEWDKQGYCSAKNMVAQSIKKNMTTAEETDDLRKRIKAALENPAIQPNDWKVRCEYLNGRPSLWKDSFWQSLIIICKDQGRWKGIP